MSGSDEVLLDRTAIEEAFRRLGDRLARRGIVADVYIFGGAAVARDLGLPTWWLNEQASVYISPAGDADAPRVFDHPGLRVQAASPEHLLAMKVLAARRRDAEDIRFLVRHLRLSSTDEVLAVCTEIFPDEDLPPRARLLLEDLFTDS